MKPPSTMTRAVHIWRVLFAVMLLSATMPTARVIADCPDTTVDAQAVRSLIGATDAASLDARFLHLNSHDPAVIAVYRKRRLDLNPTKREESTYVASLPARSEDLSRVYKLVDSRDLCGDAYVSDVFYGMFERAATLARKRGAGHEAYVRLCLLTDGEVAEFSWDWFDWLLENDTARTVAAIRELSPEDRQRVCGDADLRHISLEEARNKCASGS
jgi:hypothetical protein